MPRFLKMLLSGQSVCLYVHVCLPWRLLINSDMVALNKFYSFMWQLQLILLAGVFLALMCMHHRNQPNNKCMCLHA